MLGDYFDLLFSPFYKYDKHFIDTMERNANNEVDNKHLIQQLRANAKLSSAEEMDTELFYNLRYALRKVKMKSLKKWIDATERGEKTLLENNDRNEESLKYSGKQWLKELYKVAVPEEMWVDGSFATSKINPNDIDVVVFLNYKNFSSELNGFLSQIGRENYCDTYYAIEPNDELGEENGFVINHRNYWRGQFGFDRQDLPKGMIRFNKEELNRIKEVINNV